MYQFKGLEDTIAAISTALGAGGIGIVRLSGPNAVSIADQMFMAKNKQKPSSFKNYTLHYGWVTKDGGEVIDEALLTVMRAPKSYTKEDVVEMSCHGGMVSLRAILSLALDLGARLAEPGEFTKRAFLNGRIDLPQAEAVLDIIQAKTDAFLRVSTNQLKGELSAELETIREMLMGIYTEIEAIVNFPEDDIDAPGRKKLQEKIGAAKAKVEWLLKSSEQGRLLKEGIKIVICGKPNVGKSSLLNVLLKEPRAIVSPIAGTTRDTIEETAQIKGIPFQLVDTAGILEPRDTIEEEAVKRSRLSMNAADLVLLVFDATSPFSDEDKNLLHSVNDKNFLIVLNKCDLIPSNETSSLGKILQEKRIMEVSALKKSGIGELENAIVENVLNGSVVDPAGILVSNVRHIQSLKECAVSLGQAQEAIHNGLSLEFSSEGLKTAINGLDQITGRNIDQDLLEKIFSEFCIGK